MGKCCGVGVVVMTACVSDVCGHERRLYSWDFRRRFGFRRGEGLVRVLIGVLRGAELRWSRAKKRIVSIRIQRIGQDVFRQALMAYWGGRCPLTGITTDPARGPAPSWVRRPPSAPRQRMARLGPIDWVVVRHRPAGSDRGLLRGAVPHAPFGSVRNPRAFPKVAE